MTSALIGGHSLGLLDSSTTLLNRDDRTGAGTLGQGEQVYVNVSNGNFVVRQRDIFLPSRGPDFELVRTYNSRGYLSGLAQDWTLSTGVVLSSHQDKPANNGPTVTNYTAVYGDGSESHFSFDSGRNLWVSTDGAGAYETLGVLGTAAADGAKYVLTRADQTQYRFDNNFNLLAHVDTNGVRMEYQYQGGKLQRVLDDTGHVITFNYSGLGTLTSVTDETGVVLVRYAYVGSNLSTVTDRAGHVTTYRYDSQNGQLSKITLPNQQTVDGVVQTFDTREMNFTYERIYWDDHPHVVTPFDQGFAYVVKTVTDAMGGVTSFDYAFNFSSTAQDPSDRDLPFKLLGGRVFTGGSTKVVDALGNARATSNAAEFVVWRTANGFYATYDAAAVAANATLGAQFNAIRALHTLSYNYDADGYITQVQDQLGFKTIYTYDGKDNLVSIVDRNGYGATNSDSSYFRELRKDLGFIDVAGNGKLVATLTAAEKTTLLARFTTSFTYDTRGNLLTRKDNAGNLTTYTYTAFNRVASETSAMGNALVTSNESQYQQKRVDLGFPALVASLSAAQKTALQSLYTTTYTYDARQNLTQRTDAGGDITRFEYDVHGNLTKRIVFLDAADLVTPAKQQVTQYFYDGFGNNVETVDAEGFHTFRTFDHFGNLLSSIDGRGGVTTNTYDGDNRLLATVDPEGHVTAFAYDAVGNRIGVTDANGHTVTSIYDRNNLLIATIAPASDAARTRNTTFSYDIIGNRTQMSDAEGRNTLYRFDTRRQLLEVTTPQVLNGNETLVNYRTTYAYDGEGNLVTRTDNNGNVTQMLLTTHGLLKRETDPIGNVIEYLYDANLQQVQITIGAQLAPALRRVLKFGRDEENQMTSETDALGNSTRYRLDATGKVVARTDGNGNTTDFEYDRNNRLLKEIRAQVTDPISGLPARYVIQHQYDANGNEVATTDENGHVTTYAYDKDDRRVMITDANGIKTVFSWDSRDNQTQIAIGVAAHLDANAHVIIDSTEAASVTSFVYDEFNQLIAGTDGVGNALATSNLTLYRAMRQAFSFASDATALSAVDRSALRARFTETYEYDRVGNRTKSTDHLGRVSTQQYDALNRLQARTEALGTTLQRVTQYRYDGNDNVVKQTDALGRAARFTYDGNDRLVETTDTLGIVTRREYDNVGNLLAETLAFGTAEARTTRYLYDLEDRLVEQTDPEGHSKRYEYDAVGNRLKQIDGRGGVTRFVYDALNRNVKIIDPLSFETRYEYDGADNRITLVNARGGVERVQFDAGNRYVQTTDAEGRIIRFEYDVLGNVVTQTTAFGTPLAEVTRFIYDASSNLRQIIDAEGNVTLQDFDAVYNLTKHTDNNGNVTTTQYDALNRRIQVTDALGGVTSYAYDIEDNQLSETDALGHVRTFAYDAGDRLLVQSDALGVQTHYSYDRSDNQVQIVRGANTAAPRTDSFVYDKDDRLISQTDPLGGVTTHSYDANDNVVSSKDALGRETRYVYDAKDQLISITDPLGNVTTYVYDGDGNRVRVIDARGNAVTSYYNQNNEVVMRVDEEGYAVAQRYDANGNLVERTEYMTRLAGPIALDVLPTPVPSAQDHITLFGYDKLNRLVSQTDPLGGINRYTYDGVGNKLSETDENGHTTTFVYDALDRQVRQTNALGGVRTRAYDALGNVVSDTDENGHTATFLYDVEDRVIEETDALGGKRRYSYDAVDNRLSQTDENGHTTTYEYDLGDRLIRQTDPLAGVQLFQYDAVGNRTRVLDQNGHATSFTYDANDRIVAQTDPLGGSKHYVYDAVDNVISETDENGHAVTFGYDKKNKLVVQTDALGGVQTFSYDAVGNQLTAADENGHATRYTYDGNNRIVEETNALGGIKQFTYDGVGNTLSEVDENGNARRFEYDAIDRVVKEIDALGNFKTFAYDAAGNRISQTDENGHTRTSQYDANDRLIRLTDALGGVRTLTYDALGNQLSETDENGHTITFAYDANDRLISEADPLGGVKRFTYDAAGNRLTQTDENGHVTTFGYDANDRQILETDALGGTRVFLYDAVGNKTAETDENAHTATFFYDANDRLIKQVDALNGERKVEYDAAGNTVKEIDENGHAVTFVYDANDRLIEQIDALGSSRRFAYDATGNQSEETDENGNRTRFEYDVNQRLIRQIDALGGVRVFTYDGVGNKIAETDENGHTVRFAFDANDRLQSETDALGGVIRYTYDAVGNRLKEIDQNGHETSFFYDANDRLTKRIDALGGEGSFTYDAVGNELTRKDELGRITQFEYDVLDRRTTQTDALGGVRRTTYDAVGNVLSETDENGHRTNFFYDANDRLTRQVNALGGEVVFTYDAVGNRLSETDENGHTTSSLYDANDRLIRQTDALGGFKTFGYDAAGNQTRVTDENGHSIGFAYDANNRQVSRTNGLNQAIQFGYDAAGNRTSQTDENGNVTTFGFDANDRQTSQTNALGGVRSFTYDAAGNRLTDGDENGHVTTNQYDALDRLVQETDALGASRRYNYDAVGNRVEEVDARGNAIEFAYDANNRLTSRKDALGAVREYSYDAAGNQLTEKDENGHVTTSEYDALDRLKKRTNPLGGSVEFSYDAVGNKLSETDENGKVSTFGYDANDRLTRETDALGRSTKHTYDAAGNGIRAENPLGHIVTSYLDAADRLVLTVDPEGVAMSYTYDAAGKVLTNTLHFNRVALPLDPAIQPSVVLDAGRDQTLQFRYDAADRLVETIDAEGGVASKAYDEAGNLSRETDPNGNVTTYEYDANDRLTLTTNALGQQSSQTYDANGNTLSETDTGGNVTHYTYDKNDRVQTRTRPLGGAITITYDAVGNKLSETDETGRATRFAYDDNDRLIEETNAANATRTTTYDAAGRTLSETDESGHTITVARDAVGQVSRQTDALANVTRYEYDANGNLIKTTDGNGNITRTTFTPSTQVATEVDGLGNVTTYSYDSAGNRVKITDPLGRSLYFYYDRNNRVSLAIDAEGFATASTHDANGNIASVTVHALKLTGPFDPNVKPTVTPDSADQTTTYLYDALNRLIEQTDARGVTVNYEYDAAGNQILRSQPAVAPTLTQLRALSALSAGSQSVIHDYYDADNRRIASLTSEGVLTTYTYDAAGRESTRTEYQARYTAPADNITPPTPQAADVGRVTLSTYDAAGRLDTLTDPANMVTKFEYDAAGREAKRTEGFGTSLARSIKTRYDAAGRIEETEDAAGTITHFVLDAAGNVKEKHVAYGTVDVRITKYEYYDNNRLFAEIDPLNQRTEFTYNGRGDLTSRVLAKGLPEERTETFEYDDAGFLTKQTNGENEVTTFEYDGAGNRNKITVAPGTTAQRVLLFEYDGNNQLKAEVDGNGVRTEYRHDALGNRIEVIQAANQPGFERSTTFIYDTDNRLTTVTNPEGGVTTYEYDAVGNRKRIVDAKGIVTTNSFDALGRLQESISGVGGPRGGTKVVNSYDLFGNLTSTTTAFADGTDSRTIRYEYDVLDRQTVVTDAEGFSTAFTYDDFGNKIQVDRGTYRLQPGDVGYDAFKAARVHVQTTLFRYDPLDRLTRTTDGEGNKVTNTYDAHGNRLTQTTGAETADASTITYTYDKADRVARKTTSGGGEVNITYDAAGNQTHIDTLQRVDGALRTVQHVSFVYDGNGRATREIDGNNTITLHEIDVYGNEVRVVYALGTSAARSARTEYDGNGNKIAEIDGLGNRTTFTLDALGNQIKVTDGLGRVTHAYYDVYNRLVADLDAEGFLTTYERDVEGNIIEQRAYAGKYVAPADDLTAPTPLVTDSFRALKFSIDKANALTQRTDADGIVHDFERDSNGQLTKETIHPSTDAARRALTYDLSARVLEFSYDDAGRLIRFKNTDGVEETYTYDVRNNKKSETIHNPNPLPGAALEGDRVTTFDYDLDNRLTVQTFANTGGPSIVQRLSYDNLGNVITKTDANGNITTNKYDINNQLIETSLGGATTQYAYDLVGNRKSIIDPNNNVTEFDYDLANRQIKTILPAVEVFTIAGGVRSNVRAEIITHYDAVGNVVQQVDADGFVTTTYYDGNNQRVAEINPNNVLRTYTFNAFGEQTSASLYMTFLDASAHNVNVLPATPSGEVRSITSEYDAVGRLTRTEYPQVAVTTLTNTANNTPTATTQTIAPDEELYYDAFGNTVKFVDRNGNVSLSYHDKRNRIIASVDAAGYLVETAFDAQDNVVQQRKYHNALNLATLTNAVKPTPPSGAFDVIDRLYDRASRLIEEISPNAQVDGVAGGERIRTRFIHDAVGNVIKQIFVAGTTEESAEYSYYDASGQRIALVSAARVLHLFDFDRNGNLARTVRFFNAVPNGISLDVATLDQIKAAVSANSAQDQETVYTFDALNRQTSSTDLMGPGIGDDIRISSKYDARGNVTQRTDPQGFVTQTDFDGLGHTTQTRSPDGNRSFLVFDAAGLKIQDRTGDLGSNQATVASGISATIGSDLTIAWSAAGNGLRSYVVYDTVQHNAPGDYTNKSAFVGSGSGSVQLPLAGLAAGSSLFFRVVTMDAAGSTKWTEERQVVIPARISALSVAQAGANLDITVSFNAAVSNVVLGFGTAGGALTNTASFVLISGNTYRATLVAPADPQSLAYDVRWRSFGADLVSSPVPFEAAGSHRGVGPTVIWPVPTGAQGTAAPNGQVVIVDGLRENDALQVNGQLQFNPDLTTNGTYAYSVYYGDLVETSHSLDISNEDRQSTFLLSDTPGFNGATPPVQISRTQVLRWQHDYKSTVSVTLAPAEAATVNGGNVHVAFKVAGSGEAFTNDVAMAGGGNTRSTTLSLNPGSYDLEIYYVDTSGRTVIVEWRRLTLPSAGLPADVGITDNAAPFNFAGQSVSSGGVTDSTFPFALSRTVALADGISDTGQSVIVFAAERAGSITRTGNSFTVDPGLYTGPVDSNGVRATVVASTTGSAGAGELKADGLSTGSYFTEIVYNALGDQIGSNEEGGLWRRLDVDAKGNVVRTRTFGTRQAEADGLSPITTFKAYDARDLEIARYGAEVAVDTDGNGINDSSRRGVTRVTYDFDKRMLTRLDPYPGAVAQTFEYDGVGNMTRQTDALGLATLIAYDRRGNEVRRTDPLNHVRRKQYDSAGNMIREFDALNFETRFDYDSFGRQIRATDALGRIQSKTYDQHDRVTTVTDGNGFITRYTYDKRDNLIWTQDANAHFFGKAHDAMNRVSETYEFQGANPTSLSNAIDALTNTANPANAALVKQVTRYDIYGNRASETDAMGRVRTFTYGPFGRLATQTDESSRVTTFGYDRFGQQTSETRPDDDTTRGAKNLLRTYNEAGALTSVLDLSADLATGGTRTDYTYDGAGRRVHESIQARTIDAAGSLSATTAVVRNVTYTYDGSGRMRSWSDAVTGKALTYTYDNAGNQARVEGSGVDHRYTYDANDRVVSIANGATVQQTYSYDAAGQERTHVIGGVITTFSYDNGGRVTLAANSDGSSASWIYDSVGNITQYRELGTDGATEKFKQTYTYSENNRTLTSSTSDKRDADSNKHNVSATFNGLDKTGRLLTEVVTNSTDPDNVTTTTFFHAYTLDGRELTVTGTGEKVTGASSFSEYDANDRLFALYLGQNDNQEAAEIKYFLHNSDGQIITRFHNDGENDTPNNTVTHYLYANGFAVGETGNDTAVAVGNNNKTLLDQDEYNLIKNINDEFPGASVSDYNVQQGDTLQAVAAKVYGNPSLWYVIAEANGLTGAESLDEGTRLTIPNTADRGRITADTHLLYKESDIVGSKLPNLKSAPPSSGDTCKLIAAIILVILVAIIAVVVTIVTVGIAAPAAAAAVGGAAGIIAGLAVSAAIGAAVGFVASVITQGILIGFGLQKEFDWKQVAADTVAGFIGGATGGLGKLIEVGRLAGTLARVVVTVASAVLEAAGEAARQAIANDGRIDSPLAIGLAGVGGAFGGLTSRATRITRTADKAGKTILKVAKEAPAGTVIKGVKNKVITVFDDAGRKFVLKSADVKLVKTAEGSLSIVQRNSSYLTRTQRIRRALQKGLQVGEASTTISKNRNAGTKVVKTFELQQVSGQGRQAIFKEVEVTKTVTRAKLLAGKSTKISDRIKLKLVDGQLTRVRRLSDQFTRGQRVERALSKTFNVGKFATRTVSKGALDSAAAGTKQVSRVGFRKAVSSLGDAVQEGRETATVTRTRLLKGKSIPIDDRVKLKLVDGQIQKVRRISDQFTYGQRIKRFLGVGEFALDKTVGKTANYKFVRTGLELKPIKSGPLKGVLQETQSFTKRARGFIGTVKQEGFTRTIDRSVKTSVEGGHLVRVRRVSDQFPLAQRIQRRLGRAFNLGEYAKSRTLFKTNTTGFKVVDRPELQRSARGIYEERRVRQTVLREALAKGKSVELNDRVKLRVIDGKVERVQRVSDQYSVLQRIQRRLGTGEFKVGKTLQKLTVTKKVRSGFALTRNNAGPLQGVLSEQPVITQPFRDVLRKGGSIKVDARLKKVLVDGQMTTVRRISDQYTKTERVQRRLGRFFNVGEFATRKVADKFTTIKTVRSFSLKPIAGNPNVLQESVTFENVRRLSAQGLARRQLAAQALKKFPGLVGNKLKTALRPDGTGKVAALLRVALKLEAAAIFRPAVGLRGENLRVLAGWAGKIGFGSAAPVLLGVTYPYEDHPPGPLGFVIKSAVTFGLSLVQFSKDNLPNALGLGDAPPVPDVHDQRHTFLQSVARPTLKVILNGQGDRALRTLNNAQLEPIETHARSVPGENQYTVRDPIEVFDSAHQRQHRWLPFDWVKSAAAVTTQIYSPFTLDRGVSYNESLSANQLIAGQVAQFDRATITRFVQGSVGRVPNNGIAPVLLDNSAPLVPRVA